MLDCFCWLLCVPVHHPVHFRIYIRQLFEVCDIRFAA